MAIHSTDGEKWERRLGISTEAANFEKEDAAHCRYEPTSYEVLERLAASGFLKREDTLVDYGCGKGRVGFFLNYAVGLKTIGVEYNPELFEMAQENLAGYAGKRNRVSFVCENAETYEATGANCFYFFNPFSVEILQSVLGRIFESWYAFPRHIYLFFYYATDAYLTRLMTDDMLRFSGEIDCRDLFPGNDPKEKITVFELDC